MDSPTPPEPGIPGTLAALGPEGSVVVLCDDGTRREVPSSSPPSGPLLRVGQRVRVVQDGDRARVELWEPVPNVHPATGN